MTLMFGLPTLWGAAFLIRHRIIADENGLAFQGFRRRRFVAWKDIEDFELRLSGKNQIYANLPMPYLKIGEKWQGIPHVYAPYDAFLERVVLEAKWSRTRVWLQSDLRDDGDWPKVFQYRDTSGWLFAAGFFLCVALFAPTQISPLVEVWNFLAPWEKVAMLARTVFFAGALPFAFILTFYLPIRTRRRYLSQKIVGTREGISQVQGEEETFLRWEEIESYGFEALPGSFQPNLCVVETRRKRIAFVSGITGTKSLLNLVQDRAKNASTSRWRHRFGADEDVLGGAPSLWRDGNTGVGSKIHHYRTRSSRILLLFGFVLSALFLVSPLARFLNGSGLTNSWADVLAPLIISSPIMALTLCGSRAFLFGSLQCEENGLRQNGIWGARFVPWSEVEAFRFNGYFFTVKGHNCTIRFAALIADTMGIKDEIEARGGYTLKNESQSALD